MAKVNNKNVTGQSEKVVTKYDLKKQKDCNCINNYYSCSYNNHFGDSGS